MMVALLLYRYASARRDAWSAGALRTLRRARDLRAYDGYRA